MEKSAKPMCMNIEFNKILIDLMKQRKIKQLQLAELLGIRQSQISNWINGKSLPGYYSLKLLSKHLNVTADKLLGQ